MAETTTATSWPASTSRLTCRATLRMRSISATDVPPNFITRRAMSLLGKPPTPARLAPAVKRAYRWRGRGGQRLRLEVRSSAMPAPQAHSSIDPADVARFEALGDDWWDPAGSMRPLHQINPLRVAWLRD